MSGIVLVVLVFFVLAAGLGGVAYYTYRRKLRRAKAIERGLKMVPILIHLPPPSSDTQGSNRDVREVMREKTAQAEVLYNLISGTATEGFKSSFYGQRHIALEVIAIDGVVHFFAAVPVALVSVVEKAVQTAYPGARLEQVEDHNIFNQDGRLAATLGGEMVLRTESAYPVATYEKLERDPMEALLTTLSALDKKDGAAIQIMLRPARPSWTKRSVQIANAKRKGRGQNLKFSAVDLAKAAVMSPDARREEERARLGGAPDVSNLQLSEIESIEEKTKHPGFEVLIRVIVSTQSVARSQQLLRDIATAFALFEKPGLNGFKFLSALDVQGLVTAFIFRFFPNELSSNVLNSVELATLFHLPDSQFTPSMSVERQQSKQVDGPVQLPSVGLLFGFNDFRGVKKEIRLSPEDRRRHTYILGQTGTGKSTMLENLAVQDMVSGNGFAFIDPHGDSAEKLLAMVPKERAEDVIYFNPADTDYPLGLNLFEFTDPAQKDFLVQETINMLYKLYDPGHTGIIGPRYEHWYRNAALTLMSDPDGATFIEIPKVFTDTDYLKRKFKHLKDPTVIDFWTKEMGQTSDYHKSEMLGWFVSKFGAFQNNEMMRNIIGQTKSSFNIREVMDQKKILIVNLSKGRLGELNSQLLGMIFVIKFQAAAMSRADMPEDQRSDFSLYVDEFQNFSTDSFASILSEARKYRLNLIVANQFIGQLSQEIRDAVFGNIGTIVAHRMGPDDAEFMVKQFAPVFDASDLVNIPNYNAAMRLMIGGLPSQPFTIRDSAPLSSPNLELGLAIKQLSAAKYGHTKAVVEADILDRFSGNGPAAAAPAPVAVGAGAPESASAAPAPVPVSAPVIAPAPLPGPASAPVAVAAAPVESPAPLAPPMPAVAAMPAAPVTPPEPVPVAVVAPVVPVVAVPSVAQTPAAGVAPYAPSSMAVPALAPAPAEPQAAVDATLSAGLPGMATAPPPIGAPPVPAGVSPAPASPGVTNTAGELMAPVASIIPEANLVAEADQMVQQGGFNTMGAPVSATGPAPVMTPASLIATPVANVPLAPPPIGAPPVELSAANASGQAGGLVPTPATVVPAKPSAAVESSTLSFSDITGGKPLKSPTIDPATVPVMTPGTEPAPLAPPSLSADAKPVTPFSGSPVPEAAEPVAPLGSGQALASDPYANIEILGDLTPPVAEPEPVGALVVSEPEAVAAPPATGQPLPNDPYAAIDVMGEGPAAPAIVSVPAVTAPVPEPAVAPAPAAGPMPAIAPMSASEPVFAPTVPVVAVAEAPVPQVEPPAPSPVPESLPAVFPPEPAALPQLPSPPEPAASAPTPALEVAEASVPLPAPAPVEEPLIHFVDPDVQSVLDRPDTPDTVTPESNEPSLSGLPEGVQLVKPAAPIAPTAPPLPAVALVAPAAELVTPVAAPVSVAAPVETPAPIGAPPVNIPLPAAPAPEPVKAVNESAQALPVPDMNATLAEALESAPPEPAPVAPVEETKPVAEAPKIESLAQMLEERPEAAQPSAAKPSAPEQKVEPKVAPKPESESKPEPVPGPKAEFKPEPKPEPKSEPKPTASDAVKAVEEPSVAVPEPAPAPEPKPAEKPAAAPSPAAQIEKAEREIDDLLSVSLIHSDSSADHRRLPEPVASPSSDQSVLNVQPEGVPEQSHHVEAPVGTPQHMAEHHGLKVIQPLEPIVPPKEQFAKELAALNQAGQTAADAPAPAPAAPVQPKPAPPKPAPAVVPALPPMAVIKHTEEMLPAVEVSDTGLPPAESLAADDVAKARAQLESQAAMQKAAPAAPAAAPVPAPAAEAAPEEGHGSSRRRRRRHGQPKPQPVAEPVENSGKSEPEVKPEPEAKPEPTKPEEGETEQGSMTGKLILPTGEKPKPAPVQPKTEKPKKLAPGEVYVDESGNVVIGE